MGDCEDCLGDNLIAQEEFDKIEDLFQSATYMSTQYLKSLYKMERDGTWKTPGGKLRLKQK